MPDGGPSEIERSRQDALYRDVAGASRPQEGSMFGMGGDGVKEEEPELKLGEGAGEGEGGLDPVERLRQGQAAAALGGSDVSSDIGNAVAQAEAGMDMAKEKVHEQIDRVNHYLLVEILPEVVAFDAACLLLTTIITLPLVYWPIAALWGLEVYNDFTGNSTPLTPRLSWKSFAPPGTEIELPLPKSPLWIGWLAYVFLLSFFTLLWALIITVLAMQLGAPIATFMSGLDQLLPFLPSVGGI